MKSILLVAILFAGSCAHQGRFGVTWAELGGVPLMQADTTTTYGSLPTQFGDWRLPKGEGPFPVVMLIHGGCWMNAFNLTYMGHLAEALTNRGYATYNIEYRRLGDEGGGIPGTLDDVRAAFESIARHKDAFSLDLTNITVTGHSAGGHLALWLASESDAIRSVVGLAAITDIADYAGKDGSCNQSAKRLLADEDPAPVNPAQRQAPAARIRLISGSEDVLVPPSYGETYSALFKTRHTVIETAGHFDLVAPTSGAWKRVINAFD